MNRSRDHVGRGRSGPRTVHDRGHGSASL